MNAQFNNVIRQAGLQAAVCLRASELRDWSQVGSDIPSIEMDYRAHTEAKPSNSRGFTL